MLRNGRGGWFRRRWAFLNEVLSLNAQEFMDGRLGSFLRSVLNEVLSLNAQEYRGQLRHQGRHPGSSMKS